jgi:hypothetical protein
MAKNYRNKKARKSELYDVKPTLSSSEEKGKPKKKPGRIFMKPGKLQTTLLCTQLTEDGYSPMYDGGHILVEGMTKLELEEYAQSFFLNNPLKRPKEDRIAYLKDTIKEFIEEHYTSTEQVFISNMIVDSVVSGLSNRAQYLRRFTSWVNGIMEEFILAEDRIMACQTVDELLQVEDLDLDKFEAADPKVSLREARKIKD